MLRYMIRRLLWAIVLFIAVTVVSYVLFFVIPADPAKQACGQACQQVDVERVRHFLHLDRPIYEQYARFVEKRDAKGAAQARNYAQSCQSTASAPAESAATEPPRQSP